MTKVGQRRRFVSEATGFSLAVTDIVLVYEARNWNVPFNNVLNELMDRTEYIEKWIGGHPPSVQMTHYTG